MFEPKIYLTNFKYLFESTCNDIIHYAEKQNRKEIKKSDFPNNLIFKQKNKIQLFHLTSVYETTIFFFQNRKNFKTFKKNFFL